MHAYLLGYARRYRSGDLSGVSRALAAWDISLYFNVAVFLGCCGDLMTQRQHEDAREMISYRDVPLRRQEERAALVQEINARHIDD